MPSKKDSIGTFTPNRSEPIHRWYPYVEGYASRLVESELDSLSGNKIDALYDPFAGTGTSLVVASQRGIPSFYSETNPFMRFVIETKVNTARAASSDLRVLDDLVVLRQAITSLPENGCDESSWDGFEKYFRPDQLSEILKIKEAIDSKCRNISYNIAMLALSSIMVGSSLMMRRGDLRFARASELSKRTDGVRQLFISKLQSVVADIENYGQTLARATSCVCEDARDLPDDFKVDCVITSPPYLNGTNYIRNTKLELKINGYIQDETDLSSLHAKGIVAGINNVSKRTITSEILPEVESYYEDLIPVTYDKRIPKMVACYFRDMNCVFKRIADSLNDGGYFVMDIGDSQFAGIHIPTHHILTQLAMKHGLVKVNSKTLRSRRSKNGMILTQKLIRYRFG